MIRIPTDIWYKIFTLTCTDGGYTGRLFTFTSVFSYAQPSWTQYYHPVVQLEVFTAFLRNQPSVKTTDRRSIICTWPLCTSRAAVRSLVTSE
ncbi:hypothetical protein C8Q73DRAFT_324126 [Cubamyces lactineus]|nr:hypothetical protein C8Q73DRAFT_324126 [Cubamyces lactineus]